MKVPKIIAKEKGPLPEASGLVHVAPTLIWPSIPDTCEDSEFDREAAPLYNFVKIRHDYFRRREDSEPLLGCKAFWNAMRRAAQLLIMDTHFSKRGMISLRENVFQSNSTLRDIRIITAERDALEVFRDIKKILHRDGRLSSGMKIGIAIMTRNAHPFIHDRFAVTDGELWHFGGTVGGEQKLTAVSRGWNAEAHKFIRLFNETWSIVQGGRGV